MNYMKVSVSNKQQVRTCNLKKKTHVKLQKKILQLERYSTASLILSDNSKSSLFRVSSFKPGLTMAQPPPVAPLVPPPGLATAPPLAAPKNYREKYRTDPDVYAGHYQTLLDAQAPESPTRHSTMYQTMLNASDRVPKVFLSHLPGARAGEPTRICTLHAVSVYRPCLGRPMPYDNVPYAFDSDVTPGAGAAISVIEFPRTAFQRMDYVQVPLAAAMDTKWIDADAGGQRADLLGPYAPTEPDTRTLRVRETILVPTNMCRSCWQPTSPPVSCTTSWCRRLWPITKPPT